MQPHRRLLDPSWRSAEALGAAQLEARLSLAAGHFGHLAHQMTAEQKYDVARLKLARVARFAPSS